MNQITNKTWAIALKGNINLPITEAQKANLLAILKDKDTWVFELDGRIIQKSSILYVVPASDMEVQERKARGEWQCKEGHWNDRGSKRCEGGKGHCYF